MRAWGTNSRGARKPPGYQNKLELDVSAEDARIGWIAPTARLIEADLSQGITDPLPGIRLRN